jgi:hypothetical protein
MLRETVTVTSGGYIAEGDTIPTYSSPKKAMRAFTKTMESLVPDGGVVQVRKWPALQRSVDGRWYVRMRVYDLSAISDED